MGDALEEQLRESFAAANLPIRLQLVKGEDVARALAEVAGAPLVVVGGGDGTLGHAAGTLRQAGSALGILPLGTRNHLAAQLGIPFDLAEAAKIIAAGRRERIDLGQAGERVFVNNASLGLYTRLVRNREALKGPKWLTSLAAGWRVLRHLRHQTLHLTVDGEAQVLRTPLLFIGNNRYSLEGGRVGERDSLTDGQLSLYAVAARTPLQLVAMALRTLVGKADPERDFAALREGKEARISGGSGMDVAFDGEVQRMTLPVDFAILPRALEVVVP